MAVDCGEDGGMEEVVCIAGDGTATLLGAFFGTWFSLDSSAGAVDSLAFIVDDLIGIFSSSSSVVSDSDLTFGGGAAERRVRPPRRVAGGIFFADGENGSKGNGVVCTLPTKVYCKFLTLKLLESMGCCIFFDTGWNLLVCELAVRY